MWAQLVHASNGLSALHLVHPLCLVHGLRVETCRGHGRGLREVVGSREETGHNARENVSGNLEGIT